MRGPLYILLLALLWSTNSYGDGTDNSLSFEFETAVASIAPRATDLPVQFPNLTFVLRAETRCPVPESTASVSVSIADSQLTIVPDADQQGRVEKTIDVSRKQLGPVVVDEFCLAGNPESVQYLELKGVLSAHLSLRCRGENHESISYATSALDVALQCEDEPLNQTPGEDQPDAE